MKDPYGSYNLLLHNHGGIFDSAAIERKIQALEQDVSAPNFWSQDGAERIAHELHSEKERLNTWKQLYHDINELQELWELAVSDKITEWETEISSRYHSLQAEYTKRRLEELFSGEADRNATFLTIHAGAGGLDACDWVRMLVRLYLRYAERNNFKSRMIDSTENEGGIKSATLEIEGDYAFGYLKGENGIHRLVRISPFDSNKRRHTSFASVYVSPVIDQSISIDVKPEDIRIDTYRSSGAGGQHVNKTDSAVRITHLATGITIQCQNERSQHKNKSMAMKVLNSRLYEYYQQQQQEEADKQSLEKRDIAWGNQIRSYIFHPYSLVKDHRTNAQMGNVQAVMDGDISNFIEEYLVQTWEKIS